VLRGFLVLALLGVASAPVGWVVSDRLESRNAFCVACHLPSAEPLHGEKMREFESVPAPNLAALHAVEEPGFRCIDCHGGASFANKLRVKTVAARDALAYLVGAFGEPDHMEHPLWDEDCAQCHPGYAPVRDDDFHAFEAHNVRDFAYACVSCHRAHPAAAPEQRFLDRRVVMPVCLNCHEEFRE
jgi:predicted CXXCH cytochrome family protein